MSKNDVWLAMYTDGFLVVFVAEIIYPLFGIDHYVHHAAGERTDANMEEVLASFSAKWPQPGEYYAKDGEQHGAGKEIGKCKYRDKETT